MPSLVFTTLVPRSSKVAGLDDHSFATLELADKKVNSAPSNPTLLLCLIFLITLLLVFFISSFTYRILASRKQDKLRSGVQSTKSKNARHTGDIEKGSYRSRELKDRISGPTLLFGTSISALNDFVNRESKSRRDMDITEALFEHGETSSLAIESNISDIIHGTGPCKTCDDVSPSNGSVQIAGTTCSVTESEDPGILEDTPNLSITGTTKHITIAMSNEQKENWAGHTRGDCNPPRNPDDKCDDDITAIMAALERLADTFNALESLEAGVGTENNEDGVCRDECASGFMPSRCGTPNVRGPGSALTAIQESEKFGGRAYPRLDIARPYMAFESKEDAQAVLTRRRVELQSKPELASIVLKTVARDADSYVHATEPESCSSQPMRPESILKEKRCADASRPSRAHRPVLTSPLASGFVICGSDFSRTKPHRTGSQRPAPLRRKTKSLSPMKNSRHGCGLAHSSSIPSQRPSDRLAVHLLKRRQSQVNAVLKAPSSPSVSSTATKARVGRRRGTSPGAASKDASRASPLSARSAVTQQPVINGRNPRFPSRPASSPVHSDKTTRTLMNAGVDHIPSMCDPSLRSILPAYPDEVAETLSASNKPALLISKTSPRTSRVMPLIDTPLPPSSPAISIEHTNYRSNKMLISSRSPPQIHSRIEKKLSPCAFAGTQVLPDWHKNDNPLLRSSPTPSHNSQTHRTPTEASLRKPRPSSPAASESRIYRGPPTVARITRRDDRSSIEQNVSSSKNVLHCVLAPAVSSATPPVKRRGLTDISNSVVVNRPAASSRYSPLAVRSPVVSTSRDFAATHSRISSGLSSNTNRISKNPQLARRSLAGAPSRSLVLSSSISAMH